MNIVVATKNKFKLKEYKSILTDYNVISLNDCDITEEIPEDNDTFKDNALQKALFISEKLNKPVIADDSGLSITNLNNFPGIYSARWANPITDYNIINNKIISMLDEKNLHSKNERKAFFTCAIAFVDKSNSIKEVFESTLEGYISNYEVGENGFAYDKIFKLFDSNLTLAELDSSQKNLISHRRKAIDKLIIYLNNKYKR
ncbi:RdgB/HAM1 family non-canonical purine NTP pyrophosphatase [Spiroplasma turonicum]|uniref:dITP/XTP pyrophosphatase n=1 Tax=Spiroplasma turonicum TaxID=216946 RepID=A0A0K1P6T3_9MOLU|nr:RdgB/HAM1 family non-canonical purine NTP pyrophosphatase [Spiroplasma turonicum]AKU79592.1 dITP/XTP pyrophosphatase [Spiroplasma turonicum]ALX70614.1 dITP/XTP pyrophosphatase [Spiroplasma turonicum]